MKSRISGNGKAAGEVAEAAPASRIEALLDATPDDLAEIDRKITALQAEIDQFVREREQKLKALRGLRKLLEVKLYGAKAKQPRKKRDPLAGVPDAEKGGMLGQRIVDLITLDGPQQVQQISEKLGRPSQAVNMAITKCPMLRRQGEMVLLAR